MHMNIRYTNKHTDNFQPVSFTVSARERERERERESLCYELILLAERNKREREKEREREASKQHMGETHSVPTTAILLPQSLGCY
jgi:hypothetical protein